MKQYYEFKPYNVARWVIWSLFALLLIVALSQVQGCASALLPKLPVVPKPPMIPALPPEARQPPVPDFCLPTCLDAWNRLVDSLLKKPPSDASRGSPANATTTP